MATSKNELKAQVERAIAEHVILHGLSNWGEVRLRFPDVSESMFWRMVGAAKKVHGGSPPKGAVRAVKLVKRAKEETGIDLTVTSVVARGPDRVAISLDYMAQLNQVMGAADKLEAFSTTEAGKVKAPRFYADSAKLRLESLKTYASIAAFLDGQDRQEDMWRAVLDEIGKESRDVQMRILRRLQAVSQRFGAASEMGI